MKVLLLLLISSMSFAAQTYNCVITTQTDVGASTVSTKVLNQNAGRRCLMFQNKCTTSTNLVYIKFQAAHSTFEGLALPGASTILMPVVIPTGPVYVKTSSGSCPLTVIEGQ